MPCASAVPARRRAGGLATALLLAALLVPGGVAVAAVDPPTDDFAAVPVQEDAIPDGPYGMAIGDRNGDDLPDAFVARWHTGDVLIRQGTEPTPGAGRMDNDLAVPIGGRPREVEAVDWDRDGRDDAVTVREGAGLTVWAGPLTVVTLAVPDALGVATGDVDGDGDQDAVVLRYADDENLPVQLVRNDSPVAGVPLVTAAAAIPVCADPSDPSELSDASPTDARLADVTGDGKPDLVVACRAVGTVEVHAGDGAGGFGAAIVSSAGSQPYRLAVGDLDGDQIPDLAVSGASAVRTLRGVGDGSFGTPTSYATAGAPRRPLLVDVDGDGRLDLAGTTTSVANGNGIGYRLNRDGTFGTERRIAWTADAWDVRAADVTRDGRPDLVGIAFVADAFAVWEGRAAPDPVVELNGLGVGVYEGASGVALDAGARLFGPESAQPTGMTVSIASGGLPGDVLSATPPAPFSAPWDDVTDTLTITAASPQPLSAWRAALRGVRFAHVAGAAGRAGARAGRRVVRVQVGTSSASRSVDVWLRPPDAGELRLTGIPVSGETLSLDAGPWSGTPPIALRTTLERCPATGRCVALATDLPYLLRSADLGATLRARVVGTGPDGTSATAFSPRTEPIRTLAAPQLLAGPGDETADTSIELAFRGEDGATFACTVDGGTQTACVSPLRVAGLAAGAHVIGVVQVLPSGARSAAAVRTFAVRVPIEPPPVTVTTPAPPPVTVTTPAPPPVTVTTPSPPPAEQPRAPTRPALVVPSRATAAQLRRGLVVQVQHVAKGARATATLQSGRRRVVAASLRAARAGTLQLRLRAARGAVARLGRRGTLGLAVTVAAPGVARVTLAARIAYRR